MVDTLSRYVPILDARYIYRGQNVVGTPERVCQKIGFPKTVRVYQVTELVSRAMDMWAPHRGVQWQVPRQEPEPALTPDACGCSRKVGGLASIQQRGTTRWRGRKHVQIMLPKQGTPPNRHPQQGRKTMLWGSLRLEI